MPRPKLKICGIKSTDEARQILPLNLDYVGLNFIPVSKRLIDLETAKSIVEVLKSSNIKIVALFADQPIEMVNVYTEQLELDYVQLHGNEPADYARQIKTPIMRAIPVAPDSQVTDIINYIHDYPADYFVLDRHQQGQGELINAKLVQEVIDSVSAKIFLAGGLNPDNLNEVLSIVKPYGIDIAGGVRTQDHLDITKVNNCLQVLTN